MLVWIVFAILTALALAAVFLPALRKGAATPARADVDRAVFMDQLAEVDRDLARGAIGAAEAAAARNEIARRILSIQTDAGPHSSGAHRGAAAAAALVVVPLLALALYLRAGQPHLPDVPLAERMARATETGDFPAMIAQVEAHLRENPADLQGWLVIAPAYRRSNRFADAARAYEKIVELGAATSDTYADLGEMIVFGGEGMVSAEASRAFQDALSRDPENPKARYYAALALRQEGKTEEAIAAWKQLLDKAPGDAPWRATVEREIMAATASGMAADDQQAMIRGMVDGLEERLKTDGSDLEGWRKLINARKVLGEIDKAKAAYQEARTIFRDKPEALASLDELARSLSIQ